MADNNHQLVSQSLLTIAGSVIRQDGHGRYCLNDLHRAAGGEKRHQPSDWLRSQQVIDLIAEVEIPGIPGIQSKQGLGTFACKELVYAYAMWISARFHLQVIRAYDALVTAAPVELTRMQLLELAMQSEKERLALVEQKAEVDAQLAIAAPKAEALDRISTADGLLGLQAAGKALQQKPNKFVDWMRQNGWIYRRHGSNVNLGRADKVNAGYLTHKVKTIELPDGGERVCEQVMITPKGLTRLAQAFGVQPDLPGGLQ
jgi:phage antirepressor YoqD-like protein